MSSSAALELVRDELADPVSDYVIEAFIAALERGQAIAVDVLRSLADNVAADVQLRAEIMTSQADIRSQAIMIVVIPFAVLAYLVSRNSDYAEFYRRTVGFVVVAIGAGLATLGWRLMSRLGRIPDPPRTFGGGR
jgi:tight adherence protein B